MKHILLFAAGSSIFLLAGCGSGPRMMDANDTSTNPRSMQKIVSEDWVEISRKGVDAVLKSPVFDDYLTAYRETAVDAYAKAHPGAEIPVSVKRAKPLLMLSVIQNNTDEHINTQLMTERISEQLLNSGKVRLTSAAAGAGQLIDPASSQARQLSKASDFDQKTVLKPGTLKAYDLSLSGTVVKQTASVGRARTLSYFFSLILTDNRTGEVVWKYTDELKRGDVRPAIGW